MVSARAVLTRPEVCMPKCSPDLPAAAVPTAAWSRSHQEAGADMRAGVGTESSWRDSQLVDLVKRLHHAATRYVLQPVSVADVYTFL